MLSRKQGCHVTLRGKQIYQVTNVGVKKGKSASIF